jgi:predicted tellurium resistance membrane protein TerC
MVELLTSPEYIAALLTLIALEIVLGIDNIVFISILVGRLPEQQRNKARQLGLAFAMITRLGLLFSLVWIMGLINPLFTVFEQAISGRDIILILGGLFLLVKATHEIHNSLEIVEDNTASVATSTFLTVLVQIAIIDVVFSLDSVITAVGLVDHISIMVIAIVISVIVMMFAAKPIGEFIDTHPTFKILALSFLLLIGVTLMIEGFDVHVPKGYIYFAMAFSIGVEILNIKVRKGKNVEPIQLNKTVPE